RPSTRLSANWVPFRVSSSFPRRGHPHATVASGSRNVGRRAASQADPPLHHSRIAAFSSYPLAWLLPISSLAWRVASAPPLVVGERVTLFAAVMPYMHSGKRAEAHHTHLLLLLHSYSSFKGTPLRWWGMSSVMCGGWASVEH